MKQLKIAFVLDDGLDTTDGVQQYVLTLGEWLQRQGHEVHYLVGETTRRDITTIHSLAKNIRIAFNRNRLTIPLPVSQKSIRQVLSKHAFDIVHVQMPFSPFFGGRVIRCLPPSTGLIGTWHIMPFGQLEKIATSTLGRVARPMVKRFDSIYAVSEPASRFARQTFSIETQIMPNVVDLRRFKPINMSPSSRFKLVFLGRLVPRKGVITLLKAFHDSKVEAELVIGGDGPEKARLMAYASRYNLLVKFAGYVDEIDKPAFLAKADLAVFPSTGGESFGIVLLEAMASGSPVIAAKNAGYGSVLGNTPEALFDPSDITQLSNLIQLYINDRVARKRLLQKQRSIVKEYSVDIVGQKVLTEYQNVLTNKRKVQ